MIKPAVPDHVGDPTDQSRIKTLPNALTLLRMLLVPVFASLLLVGDGAPRGTRLAAAVVFAIAAGTDLIDGELARRRHQVTNFGKVADPIADKALTGTALVILSVQHRLPWWVTVLIIVREVGVTLLRFAVIRRGVIPASRGGKAKTATQILAIVLYVLPYDASPVPAIFMGLAVALTVATGLDYVTRAARVYRT